MPIDPVSFPQFIGNSYEFTNRYSAIERTVNWYLNPIEDPTEGKNRAELAPSPCNRPFSNINQVLPNVTPATLFPQPARGRFEYRGEVYGVNGDVFFSLEEDGGENFIGNVVNDGNPVTFTANANNQVVLTSGGTLYVWQAPVLTTIPPGTDFFGAGICTMQDSYVIVNKPQSNVWQVSGTDAVPVNDATQWSAANIQIQTAIADFIQGVISNQEYLYIIGQRRSLIYQNSGGAGFPFTLYNDTILETGSASPYCITALGQLAGDSICTISQNVNGYAQALEISGIQIRRISTFAVEQFWSSYPTVADARSFTYQWNGHLFWQITFPSANEGRGATWVYDSTVSKMIGRPCWHERTFTDLNGIEYARPEQFHCFGHGKHLVGSVGTEGFPGVTYQYSVPNDNTIPFADVAKRVSL